MDYQYSNLPLGLSMAVLMNDQAKAGFDSLSEAEKEDIILRCKDAKTKDEMDRIVDSFSYTENISELLNGPGIG